MFEIREWCNNGYQITIKRKLDFASAYNERARLMQKYCRRVFSIYREVI